MTIRDLYVCAACRDEDEFYTPEDALNEGWVKARGTWTCPGCAGDWPAYDALWQPVDMGGGDVVTSYNLHVTEAELRVITTALRSHAVDRWGQSWLAETSDLKGLAPWFRDEATVAINLADRLFNLTDEGSEQS